MTQKLLDNLEQIHRARRAIDKRHEVHRKRVLQLRLFVKAVERDFGVLPALQFDDHAHAVAVGFVAQIGDAFDFFVARHLGDAGDERGFVDLIRQLLDNNRLPRRAFFVDILEFKPAPAQSRARARLYRPDARRRRRK